MPTVNSEPVSPIESEVTQDFSPSGNHGTLRVTDNTDTPSVSRNSIDTQQDLPDEAEAQQPSEIEAPTDAADTSDKTPVAVDTNTHDKPPQYESYPEVHYAEHTQGHQFPQVVFDPNAYPQVSDGNQPEAYSTDGGPEALKRRQEKRICGLRKKPFWTILAAIILTIVILVAVLGGVLGSRAAKSKEQTSFMPTTALAAVNYTETSGVEHRRVYWQAENDDLYQSVWDSNSQSWGVSPLNPNGSPGPKVKPGTPLAAYIYNDRSHSTYEFHVFFLDTDNKIWERGTPNAADMWGSQVSNVVTGNYTAGNDSKLAAYADGCEDFCATTSVLVWQNTAGELSCAGFITNYGWWSFEVNTLGEHPLLRGSSLSLVPVWANESDGGLISLYANTGNLTRFVFNTTKKWEVDGWSYNDTLAGEISPESTITGFAQGYDGLNNTSSDIEVLSTNPGSGASWWDSHGNDMASSFPSQSDISTIAATAAGKVYTVEGSELVEWEWSHLNRSFQKSGVVNTDIP